MDDMAENYIAANYEKFRLLRKTERSEVWLAGTASGAAVILKRIRGGGLPYKTLETHPHPLWPKILCCAESPGETVVVEEYIAGVSLRERLERSDFFTEAEAARVLSRLAEGLSVLHGLGVIHRDIKPSNLILTPEGAIRLIDFDAARTQKEGQGEDTTRLGTKGYAPPEQFGYGQTDARSDLYAVGVTMKKMLGPGYRGWLTPILAKCTELDPKRRYASAAELRRAVLMRRRWAKAKTGCIFLLAALAFAFLYLLPAPSAPPALPPPEASGTSAKPETAHQAPERLETPAASDTAEALPSAAKETQDRDTPEKTGTPRTEADTERGTPQAPAPKATETAREEEAPAEAVKGYVRATYYLNGKRLGAWTDRFDYPINNWGTTTCVRQEEWDAWRTAEGGVSLPSSWNLRVHIENLADVPFASARLRLEYDDRGRVETDTMRVGTIHPGEEADIVVPLGQYRIGTPGGESPHPTLRLSLSGTGVKEIRGERTKWSIELIPSETEKRIGNH